MKKRYWIVPATAAFDQIIKHSVRQTPQGAVLWRLPGIVQITHTTNPGAAFSLFAGHGALLVLISVLLLAAVSLYLLKGMKLTQPAAIACLFLIGGGLGNLMDRLLFLGVTDYIQLLFFDFPIFNLADIAVTLSVAVLIFLLLINRLEIQDGREC